MSSVGHAGENLARILAGSVLALSALISVVIVLTGADTPSPSAVDVSAPGGVPGGSSGTDGAPQAPGAAGDGSRPPPASQEELIAAFPYPPGSRRTTPPVEPSLPPGWVQEVRTVRSDLTSVTEFYQEALMELSLSFNLSPATSGGETVAYVGRFNTAGYEFTGSFEFEENPYGDTPGRTTITVTFQ